MEIACQYFGGPIHGGGGGGGGSYIQGLWYNIIVVCYIVYVLCIVYCVCVCVCVLCM